MYNQLHFSSNFEPKLACPHFFAIGRDEISKPGMANIADCTTWDQILIEHLKVDGEHGACGRGWTKAPPALHLSVYQGVSTRCL